MLTCEKNPKTHLDYTSAVNPLYLRSNEVGTPATQHQPHLHVIFCPFCLYACDSYHDLGVHVVNKHSKNAM